MDIRRAAGNRKVHDFPVDTERHHHAPPTRMYACMGCHETRKRFAGFHAPDKLPCPTCGADSLLMSKKFHAPPKSDKDAWRVIEAVVSHGFRYHTVAEPYPTHLRDVSGFVERQAETLRRYPQHGLDPDEAPPGA